MGGLMWEASDGRPLVGASGGRSLIGVLMWEDSRWGPHVEGLWLEAL